MFSKFSLNTSKSPKGEKVQNFKVLLSGIADLESRVVEMANQSAGLMFIGVEILADLACRSRSIPCTKPLTTFAIVVEGSLIFNFAVDCKLHFSLKIQRKTNLKTASMKFKRPGTPETRPAATSCAATSATRRMRRTHVGRARRGAGVTVGHCAAPAGAHPCHLWQMGRARWRRSTGRRTARGAPLAAGAAHVAGHPATSPRVRESS
jgi:hypothetical protein